MIDACMRALIATSWLNFDVSQLCEFSSHLGRLSVDYESGTHYSQMQM
jgi:deoxyribodipyrimidine photo-lyase